MQYKDSIDELLATLGAHNHAAALEIARIPEQIKGFGHVKERNLVVARQQWQQRMAQWRVAPTPAGVAIGASL